MAARTIQGAKMLKGFRPPGKFDTGLGAQLPEAYKKFWNEWRVQTPAAVHYIPKDGAFERNDVTGEIKPIQNVPIPVKYPKEHNQGIWGGEGIVQGFQKREPNRRRVPHFWVPVLKKSVVYSAVLNEYYSITVTERTINLIHEHKGFDHYILKTLACDLKSTLALTFKRKILHALDKGCPNLAGDKAKQNTVLDEFSGYLKDYTAEEIEWYGLTYNQAIYKLDKQIKDSQPVIPHKLLFREKLVEQLKARQDNEAQSSDSDDENKSSSEDKSWINKINPFGKKS